MREVVVEKGFDVVGEEDTVLGSESRPPVLYGVISTPDKEGKPQHRLDLLVLLLQRA